MYTKTDMDTDACNRSLGKREMEMCRIGQGLTLIPCIMCNSLCCLHISRCSCSPLELQIRLGYWVYTVAYAYNVPEGSWILEMCRIGQGLTLIPCIICNSLCSLHISRCCCSPLELQIRMGYGYTVAYAYNVPEGS